jgi:hypothetical protein
MRMRLAVLLSLVAFLPGHPSHAQQPPQRQPRFQVDIQVDSHDRPNFVVTNLSDKTVTACVVEFSSTSGDAGPLQIQWDALVQGQPALRTGASFTGPVPREVGKPYPDKIEVIAGVWEDGETFGTPKWLKVILEFRAEQALDYEQAADLLRRAIDENWTYDQLSTALKGMRSSIAIDSIRTNLDANPEARQNSRNLRFLLRRLFDPINAKADTLEHAKPLPSLTTE